MSTIGINFDWGIGGTLILRDEDGNETAYMDAKTGTVRMKVQSLTIAGKTVDDIASEAIVSFDKTLDQETIFNKLTNNSAEQGIYLKDGKIYINGQYIEVRSISAQSLNIGLNPNIYNCGYDTLDQITNSTIYYNAKTSGVVSTIDLINGPDFGVFPPYGTKCLRIVSSVEDKYVYLGHSSNGYGCVPVEPGKKYKASCYVCAPPGATNRIPAEFYIVKHTGKNTTNSKHESSYKEVGSSWERFELSFTGDSIYPYVSIRVDVDSSGTLFWCCFQIEEISDSSQPASPFKPSGTTTINGGSILTKSIKSESISVDDLSALEATLSGFTMKGDMFYSKLSSGYTVIKPFGDVAMAFGSPAVEDTSGAKLQFWHNGLITCARLRFTAEQGAGSFQRAISIETPYTGVWWGNSGRQKREVEWINGYSDSEIVLLLHDNIKGYICSYNDSNEFTYHIPLTAAAGFTNGSTRDLKTNINECEPSSCLEIIKSAKVKTYYYKNDVADGKAKEKYGFVIDEDCPEEFVSYNRKGVDIYSIASICAGAVKKLSEEVEELKKENQTLKENYSLLMEDMVKIKETLGIKNE